MVQQARLLRKSGTPAEDFLWQFLRARRLMARKFRRQHPLGRFIAGFFCDDARLIIEADRAVHNDPSQRERDATREETLQQYQPRILRFTNEQVLEETENVLKAIAEYVHANAHERPLSYAMGEGEGG